MKYRNTFRASPVASACALGAAALALSACGGNDDPSIVQPRISARAKSVLTADGYQFRDANGSGKLDPYEDWRLPVEQRIADLWSRK